jgi:mono/diheme cytochrome c family protein
MRRPLLIALLLGLPLGVLLQQWSAAGGEWRSWQRRWSELRRVRGLAARAPGLVTAGPADRCVTCHLGALTGRAVGGHVLFAPHPPLACTVDPGQVGCRACHRGDGARVDRAGAHGLRGPAGRRLLGLGLRGGERLRALQAGCAGCHRKPGAALRYDVEVVPEVAAGLALFLTEGCPACHRVPGVAASREVGPPLAAAAERLSADELRERLLRPQRFAPASPMPPSPLGGEDLGRLVAFLTAQPGAAASGGRPPRLTDHYPADYPLQPTPAVGAIWARRLGCEGCHRLGERAGGVPDLRFAGHLLRSDELRTALLDPGRRVRSTLMPAVQAPSTVEESLVAWLALQRRPLPASAAEVARQICLRCHGRQPDPKRAVLSKQPPLLDDVPQARFVDALSKGRPGTAMQPWGPVLGPALLLQLHSYLRGTP